MKGGEGVITVVGMKHEKKNILNKKILKEKTYTHTPPNSATTMRLWGPMTFKLPHMTSAYPGLKLKQEDYVLCLPQPLHLCSY